MSGRQEEHRMMKANSLHLNATLDLHNDALETAVFEFKVFNIVIAVLAFCILIITGIYCIGVCYNRTRQSKRAHIYESAVTRGEPVDPVAVRAVRRSTSFINPLAFFRRAEAAKDNSRIYYIYSNPLPVGAKEDEEDPTRRAELSLPPSIEKYAEDPHSGIILDPPIFYMQL
ncbi:uncharacterized protein si:dkey-246e1.3 [Dunckerocampus dactyliophorus]|uniref:uncharacterized protein si:dkey-246e1.3 n=1 Tax=Dunckerocampus dactyliophorus TaxID=161453 RepID=UPI0024067D36|nr:uncharacterized protein si:dkey-246e1.3 [Dunckerocampus dactyliophorus]